MNHKDTANLLWEVIMGILGYDLNTTPPPVRQTWQRYGEPDFKITDNVIFLQLMYESGNDVARPLHSFSEDYGDDIEMKMPSGTLHAVMVQPRPGIVCRAMVGTDGI